MYFLNRLDEKNRYIGLKVYFGKNGQDDTHTYSYLHAREQLQEAGIVMGLERLLENEYQKKDGAYSMSLKRFFAQKQVIENGGIGNEKN